MMRRKSNDLIVKILQLVSNLPLPQVGAWWKQAVQHAIQVGEPMGENVTSCVLRKTFRAQLARLRMRLERATNELHGGIAFQEDVQQITLNLQDVLKAWPLHTMCVSFTKYKSGHAGRPAVQQTLFNMDV